MYQSSHPEPSDDDSARDGDDGPFLDALREAQHDACCPECGRVLKAIDHDGHWVYFECPDRAGCHWEGKAQFWPFRADARSIEDDRRFHDRL